MYIYCGWAGCVPKDNHPCPYYFSTYVQFILTSCSHCLNRAWSGRCWMNVAASLSSERQNVQTTMVANTQRPLLPVTLCQAPIRQPCILPWNNGTVGGYSKSQAFTYSKEKMPFITELVTVLCCLCVAMVSKRYRLLHFHWGHLFEAFNYNFSDNTNVCWYMLETRDTQGENFRSLDIQQVHSSAPCCLSTHSM